MIMYHFPEPASFLIWLLCLPLGQGSLLVANATRFVTRNNSVFPTGSQSTISGPRRFSNGTNTLPKPPYPSTIAGTAGFVTAKKSGSPTSGQRLFSNGTTTTVSNPSYSGTAGAGLVPGHSPPVTSIETTMYTLDGVIFTGVSNGFVVASTTLTPGGSPLELSSHTFSIPVSATSNVIDIDGDLTVLPLPTMSGTGNPPSATASSTFQGAGLGPGVGPVSSITLSDTSTTATYEAVLISQYSNLQTPTVIVTSFPEYNSIGSITSIQGSIIIGKGGTALIHPPSIPTSGGKIGPPSFGGPIRPPSGGKGCPSFFGISFCPPEFRLEPPGSPDLPPAELPEDPDPDNPDDSENNDDNDNSESQSPESQQPQTRQSLSASRTQPSSISASLTETSTSSATSSTASSSGTSTCSDCNSCITYDYSPNATPNPIDDDTMDMRKRELGGRFIANKRANGLRSSMATKVASAQCSVSKYTNKPVYPGPGAVANNEHLSATPPSLQAFYLTATYWAVPTNLPPPSCGAPGWQFMSTNEIGAANPPWKLGGEKGKAVNIDHVYEVSLLDEFFAAQVSAGFTCGDISKLFDVPDTAARGTRLNTIFAQLASLTNPDLVGMDKDLNKLKGALWNPDLKGANLKLANPNAALNSLSDIAVVMDMANNNAISKLFSNTNARIYQAFQAIDLLIGAQQGCSDSVHNQEGQPAAKTWASAYSVWMTGKVKSQNNLIVNTAKQISAAIPTDPANATPNQVGQVNSWKKAIDIFNAVYNIDALTFPQPDSWPRSAISIAKRQAASPACTRAPSVNPSVSVTATSTPSATPSSTVIRPSIPGSPASSPTITSAVVSTTIPATVASVTFSCTTLATIDDPDYPCGCSNGFTYCADGNSCDWTSVPPGESCCIDCF